jgi:hypothetical protein
MEKHRGDDRLHMASRGNLCWNHRPSRNELIAAVQLERKRDGVHRDKRTGHDRRA